MRRARLASLAACAAALAGCGRSGLYLTDAEDTGSDAEPVQPVDECELDSDCPHDDPCTTVRCAPPDANRDYRACETTPLACDDGDPCTTDACDPAAGACTHERPGDADGDGFVGAAPPGLPASCGGPDCDDTDPLVFPGARERCDGKDNDCNGAIDDHAEYQLFDGPVPIAPGVEHTEAVGLAGDGSSYALTYTAAEKNFHTRSYFERLDQTGQLLAGPALVSQINADTFAGSLAGSGQSFLTAWADARQAGNYEIYLTRFDSAAQKLQPDLRVTNAVDFSLHPEVAFTGQDYVVVWEDHRQEPSGGPSAIYGRRVSAGGALLGEEVKLTGAYEDAQFPAVAVTHERIGVAYTTAVLGSGGEPSTELAFRTFDHDLGGATEPVLLGSEAQDPSVIAVGDRFLAAWHTGSEKTNWGPSIVGAVLDATGAAAVGVLTTGDTHARYRSLVSLGDRALLVWQAIPQEGAPFSLYYELIDARTLEVVVPRQLLAASASGSNLIEPHAALGPLGQVGVTYNESGGSYASYFLRIGCVIEAPPPR